MEDKVNPRKNLSELSEKLANIREQILSRKKTVLVLQQKLNAKLSAKDAYEILLALRDALSAKEAASKNYRHHHVAYCELKGRTRAQIENSVQKTTPKLNEKMISRIKSAFAPVE